jgi:multicomponent K+:H+ antiporter subunit E
VITNAASLALLLLGALLAVAVPLLTPPFWPDPPRLVRPWRGTAFPGPSSRSTSSPPTGASPARSSARLHRLSPAFVEVPLDLRDPFIATLLGSVVSLTPGTVSIDVDQQRWVLLVHALDAPDPQALVREIKERYERR